jgi:16S rRNA (cytosine967-C5)-methyltransferase
VSEGRDLAAGVLLHVERRGSFVRDLLPVAREKAADPRERGLLTDLAYGVVRRRSTIDAVLAPFSRQPLRRLQPAVLVGVRLAAYQVLFLDRVPAHAAVDHAVGWVRAREGAGAGGYANAVLRALIAGIEGRTLGPEDPRRDVPREDGSFVRMRDPVFGDPDLGAAANLGLRYAMPPWLVERWILRAGRPRAEAVLRSGIARPPLALRAREDRERLLADLRRIDPTARAGPTEASVLVEGGEGAALALVAAGRAAVQDATAQRVAPLLAPLPGQRLLDLCAAPGGKSLHLADLLGRGEVVACDVDARKVAALAALPHVPPGVSLRAVRVEDAGPPPFEPSSFDGILVDAPCSNSGVLRRRVEARWRVAPEDLPVLAAKQRALLERSLPLLRPGGALVYATCSTEPEENAGVVEAFVRDHPGWRAETAFDVLPSRDADGGFAAVLRPPGAPVTG